MSGRLQIPALTDPALWDYTAKLDAYCDELEKALEYEQQRVRLKDGILHDLLLLIKQGVTDTEGPMRALPYRLPPRFGFTVNNAGDGYQGDGT